MKKKLVWILACFTAASLLSCNFPYKPEAFVLPEIQTDFATKAAMSSFIGTDSVKIAYTDGSKRDVYFLDYTDSVPVAKKLKKPLGKESILGDSPLISPDGKFVVYYLTYGGSTSIEGAYMQKLDTAAKPVLVAATGTEPHWWKDPSTGDMYVIYSTQWQVSTLDTSAGKTYKVKVSLTDSCAVTGNPELVAPYPLIGGMSKNGRYMCTGYKYAAFYDCQSGMLTHINGNRQTCNPSITPDATNQDRMMFLNIGGVQQLANPFFPTDSVVDEHSMLFIVNSANTVVDYVPLGLAKSALGTSYTEWQDPEWSNKPTFAAVLGVFNETQADGIIVKNIGDNALAKSFFKFTSGTIKLNSTSTPYIWIGN